MRNELPQDQANSKMFGHPMSRSMRFAALFLFPFLVSCSALFLNVPTVHDEPVERYVAAMGQEIVAVSEHREHASQFRFRLADFTRRDILGLSIGKQRIFISYELGRLAMQSSYHRWLLRHTLAHEIAHDVMGGDVVGPQDTSEVSPGLANRITGSDLGLSSRIRFRPYSRSAELAADRKGMEYWRKLGWDCGRWVHLFAGFLESGYTGDADHPTQERLDQAVEICTLESRVRAASLR